MPRINELTTSINSAETVKMAIFERGLIIVIDALGRWQAETGAVQEAVATLLDADLGVPLCPLV